MVKGRMSVTIVVMLGLGVEARCGRWWMGMEKESKGGLEPIGRAVRVKTNRVPWDHSFFASGVTRPHDFLPPVIAFSEQKLPPQVQWLPTSAYETAY